MTQHQLQSALGIAGLIMLAQFLPSLFLYLGIDNTSMASGTAAASFIILCIFLATRMVAYRLNSRVNSQIVILPFAAAAAFVLFAVPHAAIANYFLPIDISRLFKTLPLLFLLLTSGIALGEIMITAGDRELKFALTLSFSFLCLSIFLRIAQLQPNTGDFPKSIFPFTETSHFAIAFAPLLLYRCVTAVASKRMAWLIFGFAAAIGLQSATLLFGCLLAAIVCRRIMVVFMMGVVVALGAAPLGLEYFVSRVDFSDGVSNLSAIVYLQGWQILQESLQNTLGWGVGFEQMGIHGTQVSAADTYMSVSGDTPTNILDGSFVFAKLAGEMGAMGILLSLVFSVAAIHSIRVLRNNREHRTAIVFARCVLAAFTVDMFVRGTGYFSGSALLAVASGSILLGDYKWRRSKRTMGMDRQPIQARSYP
jgi:hypothetical protein